MSTTKAVIGKSTTIGHAADAGTAPSSYTAFLEVKKVNLPEESTAKAKATHYLSPSGVHEYLPGWTDAGEVSMECNFIDADYALVKGMQGLYLWYRITLPIPSGGTTAGTITFRGFITKCGADLPNEEATSAKVTFQASGPVTFVAGS